MSMKLRMLKNSRLERITQNTKVRGNTSPNSPLRGMRRGTWTLRRPVLDRFTSVPLVCAPERLRLSVHGRILQINAFFEIKIFLFNIHYDMKKGHHH